MMQWIMIAIIVLLLLFVVGCAQIILTSDPNGQTAKVNTLFKDFNIDELNTIWGNVKTYDSNSNPVNVITPYGTVNNK